MSLSQESRNPEQEPNGPVDLKNLFQEHHFPILTERSKRYQYLMITFMTFLWFIGGYSSLVTSFVFMNPVFVCNGVKTTEALACEKLDQCHVTNSYTAVAYDELYCEKQRGRELIQTALFIGSGLGNLLMAYLSNLIGRRKSIILSLLSGFLGSCLLLIGIYSNTIWVMFIGNLLANIGAFGVLTLSYIVSTEFFDDSMRQLSIMIYNTGWPFASISFILVYNFLPHWYNYIVFLNIIPWGACFLISLFFIVESPVFLLVRKPNLKLYQQSLEEMALYNDADLRNVIIDIQNLELRKSSTSESKSNFKDAIVTIVKTKKYFLSMVLLIISQMGYSFFYYGVQISMERFGFNFGLSLTFVGTLQFLSFVTGAYFIHKIPRKKGLLVTVLASGVLGFCFIFPFVEDNKIIQTFIVSVTRFTCSYGYSFLMMLLTESFEPKVSSEAIGLTNGLTTFSKLIIPFLVTTMDDLNIEPILACSVLYIILGITPLLCIEETVHNKKLPDHENEQDENLLTKPNKINE